MQKSYIFFHQPPVLGKANLPEVRRATNTPMQICFHENTSIPQKCQVQAFKHFHFLGNEG